jgi:GntR family transcriptional regulator
MSEALARKPLSALSTTGAAAFSPLYQQIKDLLVQALDRGDWKPGEAIPSETELALRFQVSQGTVRKAVDELAAENLLIRRQGKGTFVSTHHEARVRFRFLRLAPNHGEPQPAESQILDCKRIRASAEIARALELKVGDSVVAIRRLLSFAGVPTVVDDIYLPGALFKGLTADLLNGYVGPLYGFLETEFGISMVRAEEKLRAVSADSEMSALLAIALDTPMLKVDRISFTYADRPVELRMGHYVTDRYHYRNSLN